ncbi:MAG: DUF2314 domain-containing protein [Pseudomonadota bacterium]
MPVAATARMLGTAAFVGVALIAASPSAALAKDKVINFSSGNVTMNAAIAAARTTLPVFWSRFEARAAGDTRFSIKVKISDKGYSEHFWTSNVERDGDTIHAVIANDPNRVTTVKLGQRIKVDPADISDWMHWRSGKMHGAYTLRVMLPRLPKPQADGFRRVLAPPPSAEDAE